MFDAFILSRCHDLAISKMEFARRAGISRETLYRLLRGDIRSATIETIYGVARAAQVAPIQLLRLAYHNLADMPATTLTTLHAGDHSSLVQDVTIPDNDIVYANQTFTKVWELQNTGKVAWKNRSYRCVDEHLVLARREIDGSLTAVLDANLEPETRIIAVPDTPPGGIVRAKVNFKAPEQPCTVMSLWKMFDADGQMCFPEFTGIWCKVQVVTI